MHFTHLFNPQNDLALANGSPNYTAPSAAVALATSGAALPVWYGAPGDNFWGAVNARWFEGMSKAIGLEVTPANRPQADFLPQPWGWSQQVRNYLSLVGFGESQLPTVEEVELMRSLSSRVVMSGIINDMIDAFPETVGGRTNEARILLATNYEDAIRRIKEIGVSIIKLPWSSSGRGQQISDRTTPEELQKRINGMIRNQGAVEISPFYKKIADFAMLWEEGKFQGYSLFETDTHGGWTHNILMPDSAIERHIINTLGRPAEFEAMAEFLSRAVREVTSGSIFNGTFGVDFIVGENGNGERIMVPVEINLRRTMGHVAHRFANIYIAQGLHGRFGVYPSKGVREPFHGIEDCGVTDGRIIAGSLDIVPPGGDFRFIVSVE